MSSNTAKLTLRLDDKGRPWFAYDLPGWLFERPYLMHKTVTDPDGFVTEHAFFARRPGVEDAYEVWVLEVTGKPFVTRHTFYPEGDDDTWTLAHRFFVHLFGCGLPESEWPGSDQYETTTFSSYLSVMV